MYHVPTMCREPSVRPEPSKAASAEQMRKLRLKVTRLIGGAGRNLSWRKPLVTVGERPAGWP